MSAPDVSHQLRSPDLVAFLQSGVAIILGTARDMIPALTRGFAVRVAPDGAGVELFVAPAQSAAVVANLSHGAAVAFTVTNPTDYRSVQIKGSVADWRPADEADAAWLDRYWSLFQAACERTGVPLHISGALRCRRVIRVTVTPRALFQQTPGPGAGGPVEDLSAWK